jgi:hypothetical protein
LVRGDVGAVARRRGEDSEGDWFGEKTSAARSKYWLDLPIPGQEAVVGLGIGLDSETDWSAIVKID